MKVYLCVLKLLYAYSKALILRLALQGCDYAFKKELLMELHVF
jgi:hypothetical protein